MRAAERYGFRFEGIFRNHVVYKVRNRDTGWFAIIEEDWPPLDAVFEFWLADCAAGSGTSLSERVASLYSQNR